MHSNTTRLDLGSTPILQQSRRTIFSALPSFLVPPTVFIGLLLGLWAYKCFMTVIFQDKIIYMPYMPPFARGEKIENYAKAGAGIEWREVRIRSLDGVKISLCVGELAHKGESSRPNDQALVGSERHVVICYYQGNGASLPPRLPILSNVLRAIGGATESQGGRVRYTVVALSYRGYWTSSGRASQKGIELDAQAMLKWVQDEYGTGVQLILWGQSIGAGVACNSAARHLTVLPQIDSSGMEKLPIAGLLLETPFVSIKRMLLVLYPQKWLPYQYLHPFLWNRWDNEEALRRIADAQPVKQRPKVLILAATRDEVVPANQADELESLCRQLKFSMQRKDVVGALHTEATLRSEGIDAVSRFVREVSSSTRVL
ncbi:alpha/beta-hydrolase [Polychaeton citri CBS 116435]|uniref:Alpha/beta-hydrolase n=1 Tax=Polychaeton citri CBS 116435 TaxID=1314669 RepID=A0A9P4UQ05_9PEZI|nr:alpha/beta-hydrolase [Polychaeton citri CBS 116435]